MAINNTLYPPITDTYASAFLIDGSEGCKIYFTLPIYNNPIDIKNVQVVVRNQNTNLSVLNPEKYPSEIMLTTLKDEYGKYYVQLSAEDMLNSKFDINQYYKIQIRFTGTDASDVSLTTPQSIDTWLATNLQYFSEWSKVTLVKGISDPTLDLFAYDIDGSVIDLAQSGGQIIGKLTFENPNDNEILKSYKISLKENSDTVYESEILYTDAFEDINTFNYILSYGLKPGVTYSIRVDYTTNNNYSGFGYDTFTSRPVEGELTDINITATAYEEKGLIEIQLKRYLKTNFDATIVIRRSDINTNFTIWEDIAFYQFANITTIKESFLDNTVETGKWYKYGIQMINSDGGARTKLKEIKTPVMILMTDIFLLNAERQLKVQFNPTITSLKQNISESKTDTIGSQYPFIRRNGAMNYKTFSIGGMISSEIEDDNMFATPQEILGNSYDLYMKYKAEAEINTANDYLYEKLYRDKIIEFLNTKNILLFKSPTEGNVLVKLMSVSLTPNTVLGRRLWSFTANAVEIGECNINNYLKNGIINYYNRVGGYY